MKWAAGENGIPNSAVNTRPLRAGGATALFSAGVDSVAIQRWGSWRPFAFRQYIWPDRSGFLELGAKIANSDGLNKFLVEVAPLRKRLRFDDNGAEFISPRCIAGGSSRNPDHQDQPLAICVPLVTPSIEGGSYRFPTAPFLPWIISTGIALYTPPQHGPDENCAWAHWVYGDEHRVPTHGKLIPFRFSRLIFGIGSGSSPIGSPVTPLERSQRVIFLMGIQRMYGWRLCHRYRSHHLFVTFYYPTSFVSFVSSISISILLTFARGSLCSAQRSQYNGNCMVYLLFLASVEVRFARGGTAFPIFGLEFPISPRI